MSRLLCCLCVRRADMGAALSHPQEGEAGDGGGLAVAPPTMADVIRERKKKAGGAGLGTLRRRLAAAARRREGAERGCEHARFIRGVVGAWRVAEVLVVGEALEAAAALRDLATQADLAREPAAALHQDLLAAHKARWWCDVELVGAGWAVPAHRALLAARCTYFRDLFQRYPSGTWRVPLEGVGSSLSREELESCLLVLYGGSSARRKLCDSCAEWERGSDGDLDIINVDNTGSVRRARCACARRGGAARRLAGLLGYSPDTLPADCRYLLDSGEYADSRLVFRVEGCGAAYGFRAALDIPCHRLMLAARSRFFRSVMSRRSSVAGGGGGGAAGGAGGAGCVCVDEKVLPRRFARALLHAAYTDQVDLSLIGRGSTSPSSTGSSNSWGAVRGGARPPSAAALDDAFQLYEIARFLEMPIVVQGCEDAIVEALSPDTLPHVLRWAAAPHASAWVHRQAMRYLRDEFPHIMSSPGAARLPRAALAEALGSPFLQASEAQCLRALLRTHHAPHRDSGAAWASAGSGLGARRGGWRRGDAGGGGGAPGDGQRHALADLVALVRTEHLPHDHDLIHQAVRRGMLEPPPGRGPLVDAWLARGGARAPRCFLPYLDELRALLRTQRVPDADVQRVRRTRLTHRIPDTLYMVAAVEGGGAAGGGAAGGGGGAGGAEAACVSPRTAAVLRARVCELLAAPPAARALQLPASDARAVYRQIALRAVREVSLPDGCADMLVAELDAQAQPPPRPAPTDLEREPCNNEEWEPAAEDTPWTDTTSRDDCCRLGGAVRCASAGSLRAPPALRVPTDSRPGTCRRELPSRPDAQQHSARLSAVVPDVAMAPNANTHLLTALDYCRHPAHHEYSAGVLQLDLGDGATHTPRPGSRALRAAHSAERGRAAPPLHAEGAARARGGEEELRAALELSVMRAYSSFAGGAAGGPAGAASRATLPHSYRADLPAYQAALRARASPSPGGGGGGGDLPAHAHTPTRLRRDAVGVGGGAGGVGGGAGGGAVSRSPSASPRRARRELYRHEYRLDPSYGSSGSGSRGQSPNNYA